MEPVRGFHQRRDSEGDDVFEEAVDGDEEVGRPPEAGGSLNADEGFGVEAFEEAMDRPAEDRVSRDEQAVAGSEAGEDSCGLDSPVDEGNAAEVLQSIMLHRVAAGAAAEKTEEDVPTASAVVENVEGEKSENGGMDSSGGRAPATETVGNVEGVDEKGELKDSIGAESTKAIDSLAADLSQVRVIDVEEKTEGADNANEEYLKEGPRQLDAVAEGDGKEVHAIVEEAKGAPAIVEEGEKASAVGKEGNQALCVFEEGKVPPVPEKGQETASVYEEGKEAHAVPDSGKEAPSVSEEGKEAQVVSVPEECEAPDAVHGSSVKADFTADEKSDKANLEKSEKSEKWDADDVNLGKIDSANVPKEFGTGIVNDVQTDDLTEQAQRRELKDTLGTTDVSADEEIEVHQGKSPASTELNGKHAAEMADSEAKGQEETLAKPIMDAQNGVSDHSEVSYRGEELKVSEDVQRQDNGEKPSIGLKPAPSELLNRDFNSLEKYDESTSTDEDASAPNVLKAAVVSDSVEPPRTHPSRPAGLGSSASLLEPAPRVQQQLRANGTAPQRHVQLMEDPANSESEEYDETREKLQMIRVKFLRLAHRLGQTPHNVVVAQVLYRLGLAEQLRGSRNVSRTGAFSFDRASAMAEQLETAGQEPLDFSCTIMVIGKTGVGKSATINSIFDEVKFSTDAFQTGTKKVQDIVGMVQGIKVRVIDTPGLLSSCLDQRLNKKILHSVKQFIKKTPPDIVLYLDRLDMQNRDYGDLPLLRTITDIFGPSIWFNAIVVLTHAASAPPDGPNGTPLSYEMFVTQRSHVVQQAIRQAAGDMRLMNPVSLVENHSACRTNRAGQRVLPNGQIWKPHLLLLSFASKILAEANTLLKLQDSPPGKPFGTRAKIPPLPFLLSSLLQSRPPLKLPEEQFGDDETLDDDLDEASDSDDEPEYDELPPFKRLTKAQLAKLSKEQRKVYFDELDYREKLFMKKQLKEEKRHRRLLKKMAESAKDSPSDYNEKLEEESGSAASVPVPVPDMPLPNSFDSDNPSHRYRYLDNSNQWLVRPVLETHGWDHDVGYEGVNIEQLFVVKDQIPFSFSGQVTKDKKESNLQMELASSVKHGEGKATSFGFDMQTVGKDMAYTLRSEVRFSNFRCNKTAAGLSVNILGDALSAGVKLEDILLIHKRLRLVMTGGAMTSRGDVAYGGTLEATLRDKDHPLGRMLSTLGLSIMDWHGDLALGCNLQSQLPVGRTTNMIIRANLNNKGAGQVSFRLNSSEQLQIALVALVPVFQNIFKNGLFGSSQPMQ